MQAFGYGSAAAYFPPPMTYDPLFNLQNLWRWWWRWHLDCSCFLRLIYQIYMYKTMCSPMNVLLLCYAALSRWFRGRCCYLLKSKNNGTSEAMEFVLLRRIADQSSPFGASNLTAARRSGSKVKGERARPCAMRVTDSGEGGKLWCSLKNRIRP